jgi:hypothetical protein
MKNYLPIAVTLDFAKENGLSEEELLEFVQVSIELKKLIEAGKDVFSEFMEQKPVLIKSSSSRAAFLIRKGIILPYKKTKFLLTDKGLWYAKILFKGEQTEDCPDSPWTFYKYDYDFKEGKQERILVKSEIRPNEKGLHPYLNRAYDGSVRCNDCKEFDPQKRKVASSNLYKLRDTLVGDKVVIEFGYSCFKNITHVEDDYNEMVESGKPAIPTIGCSGFKKR